MCSRVHDALQQEQEGCARARVCKCGARVCACACVERRRKTKQAREEQSVTEGKQRSHTQSTEKTEAEK